MSSTAFASEASVWSVSWKSSGSGPWCFSRFSSMAANHALKKSVREERVAVVAASVSGSVASVSACRAAYFGFEHLEYWERSTKRYVFSWRRNRRQRSGAQTNSDVSTSARISSASTLSGTLGRMHERAVLGALLATTGARGLRWAYDVAPAPPRRDSHARHWKRSPLVSEAAIGGGARRPVRRRPACA